MKNTYDFIVKLQTSSIGNSPASSVVILNTNYTSFILFVAREKLSLLFTSSLSKTGHGVKVNVTRNFKERTFL